MVNRWRWKARYGSAFSNVRNADFSSEDSLLTRSSHFSLSSISVVSTTEAFVSDDDIDGLKAALPAYCPFADALLPGRSFFDMCAQAFPRGRVSFIKF